MKCEGCYKTIAKNNPSYPVRVDSYIYTFCYKDRMTLYHFCEKLIQKKRLTNGSKTYFVQFEDRTFIFTKKNYEKVEMFIDTLEEKAFVKQKPKLSITT